MEVGEAGSQKLQAEVSWIPTTPAKAILPKPVPIYANGEENQISQRNCLDTNGRQLNWAASAATVTNIAAGNGGTCLQPSMDAISGPKGVSFGYLLALADAASAAQTAAARPGNNEGTNPFIPASNPHFNSNPEANPPSTLLGPQNPCPEQPQINLINGNHQEPQGTPAAFCRKTSLQFAPPTPDKAIREVAGMQTHMERKDQAEKENVSAPEPDSNGTPHNRELSDPVTESSFAAVSIPSNENDNPDKGGSNGIDLNKTPQQKPRRKKHRPKVISENKPKQTRKPRTPKPVQPKENPTGKRKYVRKKGVNKTTSATPPTEVTGESTEPIMQEPAKKSCRRSLNFDIGEQPRYGNSASRENATNHDKGIVVEETQVGLAYDLNFSMKQALNDYMSLPEVTQAPSKSLSDSNPPVTKPNVNSVKKNGKRKGKVFAHDGHETTANTISKTEAQLCQNGSNGNSGSFTRGLQMAGAKRKQTAIEHADTSTLNLNGAHFNELQAYDRMHWIQFPKVQKKRRSEKGQTSTTYTTSPVTATRDVRLATYPQEHASASPYVSESGVWISGSDYNAARVPDIFEATERTTQDTSQTFGYVFSSSQTGVTRRRSRVPTRIRDFASLTRITCSIQQNHSLKQVGNSDRQTFFENSERSQSCIDALGSSLAKKKRTRKKSVPVSSAYSSGNEMHLHKLVLDNNYMALGNSLGAARILSSWNDMLTVDALTEHFRHLDINRDGIYFACQEQNALVPYNPKNQKHNGLVHKGGGAIIPFEGPFDPIKKQRPRPKVDLDDETNRVWKLLMLDINSHGIDGTDEEKAKWWEEERSVFRGRADSFIARMHLVQGDRRFSCWKGSVVDSVVGVFLTQNVSDHLSSSAFMSLAARFPLRPSSNCQTNHEEGTSLVVNEPEVHIVEPEENIKWDGKLLNQSIYDQSSMTIDNIEHSEEKEAVNSNDFSGTTSSVVSLTDESNCKISKSAESNIQEQHNSMISRHTDIITGEVHEKTCYEGGRKEPNDIVLSQCSVISSQISDVSIDQNPEKVGSYSDSNSEVEDLSSTAKYNIFDNSTSFSKLLEMASSTMLHEVTSQRSKPTENSKDECIQSLSKKHVNQKENFEKSDVVQGSIGVNMVTSSDCTLRLMPNSGALEVHSLSPFKIEAPSRCYSKNKDENDMNKPNSQITETRSQLAIAHSQSMLSELHLQEQNPMHKNLLNNSGHTQDLMQKPRELDSGDHNYAVRIETREMKAVNIKSKGKRPAKEKEHVNWDSLRIQAQAKAEKKEKTENTMDSLNWEAVRCADVDEIADAIKERGMNNMLAERIKDFLNRLVEEHGSINLEWLRDVPPDKAKEYLLSIRGLGLKSVECVRLLTLHHLAFPVDTNVGRIAVRLGWVPLQPLPESLQLHLLELYPILESIQKYLWPRLCKLDQRTLYELHYQMITFGKVFCTKSKPNCNACPMRGECRHFASAFASARLALPGPEQKSIVSTAGNNATNLNSTVTIDPLPLPLPEHLYQPEAVQQTELSRQLELKSDINICQPIIEEPATPEQECTQISENDIEDAFYDDPDEIPTIKLDMEEFALNLQNYMQENMELQEGEMSKALVALTPEAASIPTPKLKNVSRLRTEHCVYELPDTHPLLEGCDMREPDDPCKYLLAIWTPGETADSIQPPESKCNSQDCGQLCNEKECFSCNSIREANSQIVRGTLLIPCRTAMRGSFPLNGTYFQVNEVFADHQSSLDPINVPRSLIWNLNRRTVYFGTSVPSIFKGLTTPEIQQCFWRGYVCVRGFDRGTRAPRPLIARLHFPASKLQKTKDTKDKTNSK